MTNDEKATAVVRRTEILLPVMKSQLGNSVELYSDFFKTSLINMAKWKDGQFLAWLRDRAESPMFACEENNIVFDYVMEQLIREFQTQNL